MLHHKPSYASLIREHREVVRRMELGAAGAIFVEADDEPLAATVDRVVARQIEQGAALYVRERDLPKLFPSWNLETMSDEDIVERLGKAVGASAKALAAGAWHADANRLVALRMAYEAEEARL